MIIKVDLMILKVVQDANYYSKNVFTDERLK